MLRPPRKVPMRNLALSPLAVLVLCLLVSIAGSRSRGRTVAFQSTQENAQSLGQNLHLCLAGRSSVFPRLGSSATACRMRCARLLPGRRARRKLPSVYIDHVEPNSPDANKTELFGPESTLKTLMTPLEPITDVPTEKLGSIALVGAGPGDPNLLTVAAARLISGADLVICDRLVSEEIRGMVKGDLRLAKKYPGCADYAQMEIYRWIAKGLREGKNIVRLKIGDPFIFGRGGEEVLEIQRLTEGRIKPAVVPGVSSVFAAPLLGGTTLTHRGFANSVTIGTGYGRDKSEPDIIPYQEQTTSVFLMAIGRMKKLSADLMLKGYPADTPVVIIEKASCSDQRVILADLTTAPTWVSDLAVKPPATIVVGEAARALYPKEQYAQGLVTNVSGEGFGMPITSYDPFLEGIQGNDQIVQTMG